MESAHYWNGSQALSRGMDLFASPFGRPLTANPNSEALIIDRCRKQDAAAFGQFVDLYQSRVFGFVRRMVADADEAADLSQEVFIRAFQHFGKFDGRSSVKTWLFRIAHNLCIDAARRSKRHPVSLSIQGANEEDEQIDVPDVRWEPEKVALDGELAKRVEQALEAMSEKLRSVLLLHDREDMAYEEIGATLDIPVGTVKSRLFLARNFLKSALADYLGTSQNRNSEEQFKEKR